MRNILRAASLAGALVLATAGTAAAADNTVPSRAEPITVGSTFYAVQPNGGPDLWRLDQSIVPGQRVQVAVDNTHSSYDLTVCVIGPVDDFGYDAEVAGSCDSGSPSSERVDDGRSARVTLTYRGSAGQPMLRFSSYDDNVDEYSATVEALLPVPPPVPPDTDDDGVPDDVDACPTISGVKPSGCRDSDSDGVTDNVDRCSESSGSAATGGCPDGDGDGLADIVDRCSSAGGPAATAGCPDGDGDGVADLDDRCGTVAGPGPTGCPPPAASCRISASSVRRGRTLAGRCANLASGARLEVRWYRVSSRTRRATKQRSVFVTVRSGRVRIPTAGRKRGSFRVSLWRDGGKLGSRVVKVR